MAISLGDQYFGCHSEADRFNNGDDLMLDMIDFYLENRPTKIALATFKAAGYMDESKKRKRKTQAQEN
ncbi:hypothetical protein MAM1_0201d07881 [Mucor ambiguus]|uniref:Uncharacterized protein n=1 Tax=Mucor ambiguus TaxID=91626 RepID=A0A0C9MXR4_9FUNG|nr:hypothetical protein MAM1_0201d07881 [Mucor ambiguus]